MKKYEILLSLVFIFIVQATYAGLEDWKVILFAGPGKGDDVIATSVTFRDVGFTGKKTIYSTVKEAHDRAIENIKPGMKGSEADKLARDIIDNAGYGKYFGHSLGHSVGLEVHDGFRLSSQSEDVIQEGMVLTVEPGIYIPELGGVRLEDMILVKGSGNKVLTCLPKTLAENTVW